jgi:hypothetical protein
MHQSCSIDNPGPGLTKYNPITKMKHTQKNTPDQLAVEKAMRALAALTIVMIIYIALILKGGGM